MVKKVGNSHSQVLSVIVHGYFCVIRDRCQKIMSVLHRQKNWKGLASSPRSISLSKTLNTAHVITNSSIEE